MADLQLSKEQAQQKNIEVNGEYAQSLQVFADVNMIDTVIRNILSNAVKFTPQKGIITVKTGENNSHRIITITDTGIGLTPDQRKNLFNLSSVNETGTNGESGTGLGLVISKEFTEKNKGEIWASENYPKGTAFHISIPKKEL